MDHSRISGRDQHTQARQLKGFLLDALSIYFVYTEKGDSNRKTVGFIVTPRNF